jgi:hypothetical protein
MSLARTASDRSHIIRYDRVRHGNYFADIRRTAGSIPRSITVSCSTKARPESWRGRNTGRSMLPSDLRNNRCGISQPLKVKKR